MFRKSLLCLEKEKLFILSKELNYRGLICDFFDVENSSDMSEKKDLEHSFRMLKHQIIDLKKSIESNFNTLSKNIEKLDAKEYQFTLEIESLIYLDMIREYIKYIVNKADIINTKLSQLLRDGYNQYLPKPITGKRYSNANITSQVEYDLKNRLKKLLNDDKDILDTMIVWDYDDDYKISKYNIKNKNKEHMVFKLSYWYFELSYFLPNLTHEIGHILQKRYDFLNPTKLSNILQKSLKGYLLKSDLDKLIPLLSEEIFSDVISFLYHGNSYLYAISHKQLGEGLSNSYKTIYDSCYDKNHQIIDTQNIKNIKSAFNISILRFNYKRDSIFIRIYVLLNIRDILRKNINFFSDNRQYKELFLDEKFEFSKNNFNVVNNLKRLLNSIYNIEKKGRIPNSLESYYLKYKNYNEEYISALSTVENSIKIITKYFNENTKILYNILNIEKNHLKRSTYRDVLPTHFNEIWNKRYDALKENKTIHRFEYRKKLHKKVYEKLLLNNLIYDSSIPYNIKVYSHSKSNNFKFYASIPYISKEEIKPYSMVFSKFRLDEINNYNDIEELPSHNDIIAQGKVLGMYDYMYIKKLNETYTIEKIYKPKMYFDKLKYYESYYSLMKILSNKNGNLNNEQNILSATIQIEVMKNLNSGTKDIYNDLYQDLVDINNILNKIDKRTYKKIEIFKSLGPKDIIVHINQATIETIYELKKDFYNKFNRTYTTLYLNNYDLCFKDTKYYFVSNLRMSSKFTIQEFKNIYKDEKNIFTISLKTGVMDYVIVWKREAKLNDIINFHNKLLEKKLIYDIQTSIEEELK